MKLSAEMKKKLLYVLLTVLLLLLFGYAVYRLILGNDEIKTDTVIYKTVSSSVKGEAYIFTDSMAIPLDRDDVFIPLISDAQPVKKGDAVANVYSGNEQSLGIIENIGSELYILTRSNDIGQGVSVSDIDNRISFLTEQIHDDKNKNELDDIYRKQQQLHILLNKRDIITGKRTDLDEEIEKLNEKIKSTVAVSDVTARQACAEADGYYFSGCTAAEELLSSKLLENITYDEYMRICSAAEAATGDGYIGKIVYSTEWFFTIKTEISRAHEFVKGEAYKAMSEYYGTRQFNVTLYNVLTDPNEDEAVLIFSCTDMNEDCIFASGAEFEVISSEVYGAVADEDAIKFSDGVCGVYAVRGNVLKFIPVDIIVYGDSYCVIRPTNGENMEQYDRVAVGSGDIYDGKLID